MEKTYLITDYVMPVSYKNTKLYEEKFNKLNINIDLSGLSKQRAFEAKLLICNEASYISKMTESQIGNLLENVSANDIIDFFDRIVFGKILDLFKLSQGNFFAMQTVLDTFNGVTFKPRPTLFKHVSKMPNCSLDRSLVLSALVPLLDNTSLNFRHYRPDDIFYGDLAYIDIPDSIESIMNLYYG